MKFILRTTPQEGVPDFAVFAEQSAQNAADSQSAAAQSAESAAGSASQAQSSANTAATKASESGSSAQSASSSATAAASSASTATTKALESNNSASNAATSANAAAISEVNAVAAAAAAAVTDNIKPDTATGISDTTSGQYFSVISQTGNGFIDLYLNDSGTAVYQDTYPNKTAVDELSTEVDLLADSLTETTTSTAGSENFNDLTNETAALNNFRVPSEAFPSGGVLGSADISIKTGGSVTFYTYSRSGDTFTVVESLPLTLNTLGIQNVEIGLDVPVGGYVGVKGAGIESTTNQWVSGVHVGQTANFTGAQRFDGVGLAVTFNVETSTAIDVIQIRDDVNTLKADVSQLQADVSNLQLNPVTAAIRLSGLELPAPQAAVGRATPPYWS